MTFYIGHSWSVGAGGSNRANNVGWVDYEKNIVARLLLKMHG